MKLNQKRRVFLKGSVAASTVGLAVGAGLLTPATVLAAWNESAFHAKSVDEAIKAAAGAPVTTPSDKITIKAPDIAENGAVVKERHPAVRHLPPAQGHPARRLHPREDGQDRRCRRGQGGRQALFGTQGRKGHHRRLRRLINRTRKIQNG